MGRIRGSLSVSLAVVAAAQLLCNPLGHAQAPAPEAAPPPPQPQPQPQAEPQVQVDGQPGQSPNVAPPPPYAPPYAPYAQPYPPPVYGPIVTLRADSPKARLQVMTQLQWRDVCVAPCNVPVHPGGVYRVGGGSIRGSESFNMPRPSGPVLIDAQVGSKVKRGIGIALTVGGGVSALLGGVYLLAATEASNTDFAYTKDEMQALGIVYLVVGAVLMVIGIPMSASTTSVQIR